VAEEVDNPAAGKMPTTDIRTSRRAGRGDWKSDLADGRDTDCSRCLKRRQVLDRPKTS
jgi:hypothetical protein